MNAYALCELIRMATTTKLFNWEILKKLRLSWLLPRLLRKQLPVGERYFCATAPHSSSIPILLAELGRAYAHLLAEHAAEIEAVFVAAISGNDVKRPLRGQEQSARMLDPERC